MIVYVVRCCINKTYCRDIAFTEVREHNNDTHVAGLFQTELIQTLLFYFTALHLSVL